MTDATNMPLGRYFTFVGSLLLALLFLADWYFPKPVEQVRRETRPSGIRISSVAKWPERVVYDTSRPTIVPPPQPVIAAEPPVAAKPRDSFAMATPVAKPAAAPVRKKVKIATRSAKRQYHNRLAVYQAPPMQMGWGWSSGW